MKLFVLKLSRLIVLVFAFSILHFSLVEAQPLPERVPLVGKITTTSGSPIGGALVTVRRQDTEIVGTAAFWGGPIRTGADGTFSFPEAEEGTYYLVMDAAGYAPHQWTLQWTPEALPYQVKLLKLTPLPLRVTKPNGTPAAGAKIQLHLRNETSGRPLFPAIIANGEGKIIVPDLVPANYWLHAVVSGKGYAILPSVEVKENNPVQVDVPLREGGRVRALAQNEDGKPVGGAALGLSEALPNDAAARTTGAINPGNDGAIYLYTQDRASLLTRDGDGAMELADVAPGRYQARLFLPGEPSPASQTIEVKAGETVEVTAKFALRKTTATLEITVQTAAGQPAANQEFVVRLQPLVNGQPVPLGEAGPPMPPEAPPSIMNLFQGVLLRRVRTDADGKAMLFPLRPGAWRVTLADPEKPEQPPQQQPTTDVQLTAQGGAVTMKLK